MRLFELIVWQLITRRPQVQVLPPLSGLVSKILIYKTFSLLYLFCFAIDKWHNIAGEEYE